MGDLGLIPGSGKSPGEGHGNPVFLPGESPEQQSLVGYSSWNHKESDTTEPRTVRADDKGSIANLFSIFIKIFLFRFNKAAGIFMKGKRLCLQFSKTSLSHEDEIDLFSKTLGQFSHF